ncbi:DNA-entry nuclease [Chryseobacterium mucoviscidosis]|nr:DNA-entry nuclease [Chryseobacterium mucoviscidosis]
MKKIILPIIVLATMFAVVYFNQEPGNAPQNPIKEHAPTSTGQVVELIFPADRYPETSRHIQEAIESGQPATCTIDREGAEENRKLSLKGVETKKGYDRDEWPMAMCAEGGEGADIEYISPSDNRGAGSWVGNQLEDYPDGTLVEFIFE